MTTIKKPQPNWIVTLIKDWGTLAAVLSTAIGFIGFVWHNGIQTGTQGTTTELRLQACEKADSEYKEALTNLATSTAKCQEAIAWIKGDFRTEITANFRSLRENQQQMIADVAKPMVERTGYSAPCAAPPVKEPK